MNINKLILLGNIGRIGRLTYFDGGNCKLDVSLATTQTWTPRDDTDPGSRTTWHRIEFRNADALQVAKWAIKGQEMYIEGPLHCREWGEEGKKSYVYYVDAHVWRFGRKPRLPGDDTSPGAPANEPATGTPAQRAQAHPVSRPAQSQAPARDARRAQAVVAPVATPASISTPSEVQEPAASSPAVDASASMPAPASTPAPAHQGRLPSRLRSRGRAVRQP